MKGTVFPSSCNMVFQSLVTRDSTRAAPFPRSLCRCCPTPELQECRPRQAGPAVGTVLGSRDACAASCLCC